VYCKKISTRFQKKLSEEIHFEVCPYGDSGSSVAAAARHSPGYLIEPAARRRAAIEARGHSELGAFGTGGAIGL